MKYIIIDRASSNPIGNVCLPAHMIGISRRADKECAYLFVVNENSTPTFRIAYEDYLRIAGFLLTHRGTKSLIVKELQ